jgi:hypothetical protein
MTFKEEDARENKIIFLAATPGYYREYYPAKKQLVDTNDNETRENFGGRNLYKK